MQAHAYADTLSLAGLKREHLICPVFVSEKQEEGGGSIAAMPGISISPFKDAVLSVQKIFDAGIRSIIVFGIPKSRDGDGSAAADRSGVVQRATREIKSAFGRSLDVITDVCVCQYNLSGHCGLVRNNSGTVDNDSTLEVLAEISQSHAEAGADIVAPSAMMDGQVRAIRSALDKNGHYATRILSYSAKHASSLYTPFRSAAFAKKNGAIDKAGYQVSFANPKQAIREIAGDIEEGADMVMVKPGLAYLDLVRRAKERFSVPVAVQNVSGEYAMIKAAGMMGWIDEEQWKITSLAAMRRAGADRIISYFALDVARYLQ
ncbi:delta-aminolevulinic acid dehydratase [Candidatus Nitrososphaera evergladensis SR1]|uniref:Delta-aminolevulinic acid dehydratase n=1 Tax=Candidatus Nitrososphaera evergladensis SR1 TaxID=1459636 RepID=A0A075MNQ4_9ARCH|nr:porphobilinogen synthase [Candidatus Nitrososphaera evergladensis]AIF82843.1 delta-aminolevulinic acid dehydratase [Candidatus Nitrososphaera evergladensis SR1]